MGYAKTSFNVFVIPMKKRFAQPITKKNAHKFGKKMATLKFGYLTPPNVLACTKPLANLSPRARKRNIKDVKTNLTLNAMIIPIKIVSTSQRKDAKIKRPKSVRMFLINIVKMFTDADLNKSPEGSLFWFATMALTRPSPTKK